MNKTILIVLGIIVLALIATALTGILWAWVVVIALSLIIFVSMWRN